MNELVGMRSVRTRHRLVAVGLVLVSVLGLDAHAGDQFQRVESSIVGEYLVSDSRTNLVWQGCHAGLTGGSCSTGTELRLSWEAALAYCEDLTWAGTSTWRLPDIKELRSIVEERRTNPSVDLAFFPATPAMPFWASTTNPVDSMGAWDVLFLHGRARGNSHKLNTSRVRCVRPGP